MQPLLHEPSITINGTTLTDGQAMSVREAMGEFLLFLQDQREEYPEDRLLSLYLDRVHEVVRLLHNRA